MNTSGVIPSPVRSELLENLSRRGICGCPGAQGEPSTGCIDWLCAVVYRNRNMYKNVRGKQKVWLVDTARHQQTLNPILYFFCCFHSVHFPPWIDFLIGKKDWQRFLLPLSSCCTHRVCGVERYCRCEMCDCFWGLLLLIRWSQLFPYIMNAEQADPNTKFTWYEGVERADLREILSVCSKFAFSPS